MPSFILGIARTTLGVLLGGGGGGMSNTDLRDALVAVWGAIAQVAQWAADIFKNERDAWGEASQSINAGAQAIGQTAYNDLQCWNHLLDVILPNTVRWTIGNLHEWTTHEYDPQIATLNNSVSNLAKSVGQLETWRKDTADPDLKALEAYVRFLKTWPTGVLDTVHEWLQHPDKFASFAVVPLTPALINYLNADEHKQLRDNMTVVMMNGWSEAPEAVANRIADWLQA